jgi:thiamine kinase-like enzyme
MPDLSIPETSADLTPQWLTAALRESGVLRGASVSSARVDAIGVGAGFIGDVARVTLAYDRHAGAAPATLIAKLPTRDPHRRNLGNLARFNEREIRFYRDVAATMPLRTPRCYFSAMDVAAQRYALLLEDLLPARVGDQVAGCSVADAELVVRSIAQLHAAWWESGQLDALTWMPELTDVHPSAEAWWQSMWERCVERRGGALPDAVLRIGERFGRNAMWALSQLRGGPQTVVHGDFRLDNLFFGESPEGPTLAVADWQLATRGRAAFDLAFFLSGNLSPADRSAHELRLLGEWRHLLIEYGVRGYEFDQALRDYRLATLFSMTFVMILLSMLDGAPARSAALFDAWLDRVTAAIDGLDVEALLPRG